MKIIIDEKFNGKILREYLRQTLCISRKQLIDLKQRERGIVLNGERVTVRAILKTGDILELEMQDESASDITPIKGELDIVYEDSDIILINKPFGVPTHPSRNHIDDTLANYLMHYYENREDAFVFRAINRLDRDTSGLVLVAKTKLAASKLSNSMKQRQITKEYIAILNGEIGECGVISNYIRRRAGSTMEREVCNYGEGGDNCITEFNRIYSNGKYSIVNAKPITGRTHQLRVHFSFIGHSIVGDTLYGKGENGTHANRHLLHAHKLTFCHPQSGNTVEFFAPIPLDMEVFIEKNDLYNV